jgi:hypothetical protein
MDRRHLVALLGVLPVAACGGTQSGTAPPEAAQAAVQGSPPNPVPWTTVYGRDVSDMIAGRTPERIFEVRWTTQAWTGARLMTAMLFPGGRAVIVTRVDPNDGATPPAGYRFWARLGPDTFTLFAQGTNNITIEPAGRSSWTISGVPVTGEILRDSTAAPNR